ncbi:MAG TPA: UvrD-helicase domain-containing protein [Pirellulaceae bacterium]|nr:UvrD-helicase domain-containing protein [Pirellulaceae bacterium]
MSGLNPAQDEAVNTLRGPMLVLAGAGSGKTRVVTFRIANLIKHRTRPERILAVTFTNKAAAEMQERISALLGKLKERPQISTFHAHCVRVLRRHANKLGYPQRFAIYDRGDQESLARGVLREIRVPSEMMRPSDLLYQISRWKTFSLRPADAAKAATSDKEHLAAMGYRRYQKSLQNAGAVDFDDLLLLTEELFTQHAAARKQEAGLFDHLLVDEYQDTNRSQYRIIKALAAEHRNLCVVGDDDQSIYGWRGAEVEHILRFAKDWPEAKVVRLEWNYRSTAAILEIANRLIGFNKHRHDKVLRAARAGGEAPRIQQYNSETEEAEQTVADIRRRIETDRLQPKDFAILFRTNEQPRAFETELRKAKIPYVILGSQSFFDRKEVKDVLAYLRTIDSPRDEVSLLRIINNPPRGIGDKTVETLLKEAVTRGQPIWEVLRGVGVPPARLPANAQESVAKFASLIDRYHQQLGHPHPSPLPKGEGAGGTATTGRGFGAGKSLVDLVRRLLAEIGYEAELKRQYSDPNEQQARWQSVEEVVNALGIYEKSAKKPSLGGFIDEVALGQQDMGYEKDKQLAKNAVALLTMHAAKGLEFPHVYLVGLEEGLLPHHRSLGADQDVDEERRLCYVGVTRAQERLTLSLALTRMKWGKPRDTIPSRFLYEIMGQAEKAPSGARHKPRLAARPRNTPSR